VSARGRSAALILVLLSATWWLTDWVDGARFESPDSEHAAVTQTRRFRSMIPSMPGQSGDKPGRLRVFGPSNQLCGTLDLPMVNMAYDATWEPTQLSLRLLGAVPLCD
jgi:hypothetical protein